MEYPLLYDRADGWTRYGRVASVDDGTFAVRMPGLTNATLVEIDGLHGTRVLAQSYSLDESGARCRALSSAEDVAVGAAVVSRLARLGAFVGCELLGACVDAWGRTRDVRRPRAVDPDHTHMTLDSRLAVEHPMHTDIAAIDALLTLGYGQRIALLAGSGVGKSSLLRRIVSHANVDARVVALIGERGREAAQAVAHFRQSTQHDTTTLVCATADATPVERFAAARTATAQAEHLAARGADVLLVFDSLTRVANAWRELALASGERVAQRGYPASLVPQLARLVERAGRHSRGSITAVYAVLVEADDTTEPVTDSVRALLDGHIVLSRRLADAGRYPAIDVLRSLSRTMDGVVTRQHVLDAALLRRALDTLERAEDLFAIGAYQSGGDPWLDACVAVRPAIEGLIHDGAGRRHDGISQLASIASGLR